jgi:hypothetical protein
MKYRAKLGPDGAIYLRIVERVTPKEAFAGNSFNHWQDALEASHSAEFLEVDQKGVIRALPFATQGFPERFRALLETTETEVIVPDRVWLSFAVCGCEQDSCGWQGWILENGDQECPVCGKLLFRTQVEKEYILNSSAPTKVTYDYQSKPTRYKK